MDGEAEYTDALKKYDKLAETRNDPSFWADNLVRATEQLKNPIAWRNFYAVLGNSDHVSSDDKNVRTLNDFIEDHRDGVVNSEDISPIQFTEERINNGNNVYIKLTPNISKYIEKQENAEKSMDLLPEIVESTEEKCWEEPPRKHEASKCRLPQVQGSVKKN